MNPEDVIIDVKHLVESDRRSEIRLKANGGNSILIVCDPQLESEYILAIKNLMEESTYGIIDLTEILTQFVETNKDELEDYFKLLEASTEQIFKSPEGENSKDLFQLILLAISKNLSDNKIPVLVNSGVLYGSGIDNIHIMENELIMNAPFPLIILYPATKDGDKLMFLSKRPASKYRCMILD